jgi:hypothetical protein
LLRFVRYHRRPPEFRHPTRISDKLALRILKGQASLLQRQMTDKLVCAELARDICPNLRFKRIYAVYDTLEQFSLASLPERFALKPNHASGLHRLVLDKGQENESELRILIADWLRSSYYRASQEPHYCGIQPKVFAEELTLSATNFLPDECRLFCFRGKVEFIEYEFGETMDESVFADRNWNRLQVRYKGQQPVASISRPSVLEGAIEAAEKLSLGLDFLRVDLFDLEGELVFNGVAISPWGGLVCFEPDNADKLLGGYWRHYAAREAIQNGRTFIGVTNQNNPSQSGEIIVATRSASSPARR